jgi:hypothetical protein
MRDETKRENDKVYDPVCSRCDRSIEPGEKMFVMHVSLLKVKPNYTRVDQSMWLGVDQRRWLLTL